MSYTPFRIRLANHKRNYHIRLVWNSPAGCEFDIGQTDGILRQNYPSEDIITVDNETLFTVILVIVDDWYKLHGVRLLKGKRGAKPEFSASEGITLLLAMDYLPFPGERQFWAFICANCLPLSPKLIHRSQFNRRVRDLRLLVEELRRYWLTDLGAPQRTQESRHTKGLG